MDDPEPDVETIKLILQTDIVALLRAKLAEGESIQHAIIKILAKHFKVKPVLRVRGQRGPGKKTKGTE